MKKHLLLPLILLCGILLFSSCRKESLNTKYITLNETVNSGGTYSLEPGIYGDADDVAIISTQAAHYNVSQIDTDAASGKNIYHFNIAAKMQDKETVVITLKENHHGRGHHCNGDVAVISINLTVL